MADNKKRKPAAPLQWPQVRLEPAEISAIKAMAATHPRAFDVILDKLCLRGRLSFQLGIAGVDGSRMTDFNEGRRYIGQQLEAIVALKLVTPSRGGPPGENEQPAAAPAAENKN